jgi:hypothetical protein
VDRLYDIEHDPEHLHQLARETNRTPYTAKYNQGIVDEDRAANEFERMAHEYGYKGVVNHSRKIASLFGPQEVQRYAKGGIVSALDQALGRVKRKKGSYNEYLAELRGMPGVKPAEIEQRLRTPHSAAQNIPGYDENKLTPELFKKHFWLSEPPVTRELRPGDELPGGRYEDLTHEGYEQYTIPGGKDYREMLFLHRPRGKDRYHTNHYEDIPDVLGHARLKDRTGPNGEKVLHVEELQSDWHQDGRKYGYKTRLDNQMLQAASDDAEKAKLELKRLKRNHEAERVAVDMGFGDPLSLSQLGNQIAEATGPALRTQSEYEKMRNSLAKKVPDAPFKKDWHEMMLKHLLVHAAKNGYDTLAVTPGEEQAKRFDISKHIGEIHHSGSDFVAYSPEGKTVIKRTGVRDEDLPGLIGAELTQKLMAQKPQGTLRSLTGQDIKVGGEGMKGFYDKMIPTFLNKIGKPHGAQVGTMAVQHEHAPMTSGDVLDDLAARGHSQEQINNMQRADLAAHRSLMEAERAAQPAPQVNLHALPITPQMREHINNEGLPLYAKGGGVDAEKNLQAFLKDSKVQQRMYHGTTKDFTQFHEPLHGNFVTPDPEFANAFLGERSRVAHIMPVHVRVTNPWDFENPEHMAAVKRAAVRKYPARHSTHATLDEIGQPGDNWSHIEHPDVQDLIKGIGHDAYYTSEGGTKNLAVYDPRAIKSAIGNEGTYDPEDPDIRKANGGDVSTDTMRAALALRKKPKAAPQDAAYDPEKYGEKGLLLAEGGNVQTQNNVITTLAQRLGMTPDQVMQAIQQQPQGLAEGGQPDKKRKAKTKGRLSLSDLLQLSSVGAEEAPDLPIKEFVNPKHSMIPEGGVQMPNGAPFPMGPQQPQEQQQQAVQAQTGIPGQVQGGAPLAAIAAMLHQGAAGAPQQGQQPGQGNMLALTRQGQQMQAMRPPMQPPMPQRPPMPPPQRPGMQAMAKGGKVTMSTADMRRALEARKRKTK